MLLALGILVSVAATAVLCGALWLYDPDGAAQVLTRVRCAFRGVHRDITRQALGGFRCACGVVGADLHDMGYLGGGYVHPIRKVFSRANHEITQTSAFEPTRRGW